MEKFILGIDQGTTGTKVIIFDKKLNIVGSSYSEFTQYYPEPGLVEHDPEEIWTVTLRVINEALENGGISPERIEAIGISNQRETTTFWDKKSGKAARKSIVWQDRRGLSVVEHLVETDKEIVDRTGAPMVPNIASAKIKWLMDNDEFVRKGIEEGNLVYGTIDTWLVWKLSGGKAHVSDLSNTSVTALLNAHTLDYDSKILESLGIPREILPELRSSSEIYAYTDETIFGARVPISALVGDQQGALFGQACIREGMAKNTYGTGSFMILNIGSKFVRPPEGLFTPILWQIKDSVNYGIEGMADVSGAAVHWLRDMGIVSENSETDSLAESVSDNGGVYFVPAFVGLGSPYFDSYARGAIFGLSRGTGRGHMARAVLESMAYQVKDVLDIIEKTYGKKIKVIRVDGGGAKSDFLMQFQADILNIPVERPKITETSCLGAVYLAGLAVGYWDSIGVISQNWQLERRFEPSMSQEERERLYKRWQRAVQRTQGWLK